MINILNLCREKGQKSNRFPYQGNGPVKWSCPVKHDHPIVCMVTQKLQTVDGDDPA